MAKQRHYIFSTPTIVAWLVAIIVIIAIYFIFAKHETPYTAKAIVNANVLSLSPEVSGYVTQSSISLRNQFVNKGDLLLTINQKPYQLKVNIAKNQFKIALQQAKQQTEKNINASNAYVQLVKNKLKLTKLYLNKTQLRAPAAGFVDNMSIHPGDYIVAGESKIPFIVANSWWIEGLTSENSLSNIQVGQPALVVLDLYPGRIFHAKVTSVSRSTLTSAGNNFAKYNSANSWFQPQQVFPFGLNINPNEQKHLQLRVGATGSVVVLKPGFSIWNGLAYVVMWFKSLWAYL